MSAMLFINGTAHGHINPTLPLMAELTRRGETVYYCSTRSFKDKIESTGAHFVDFGESADTYLKSYKPSGDHPLYTLLEFLLSQDIVMSQAALAAVKGMRIDYVIHDAMLGGGAIVARTLGLPAICTCSSFASERLPAPPQMLEPGAHPQLDCVLRQLDALKEQSGLPLNLMDIFFQKEALNIVFTSSLFQPGGEMFDDTFRFVGPSIDNRRENEPFPLDGLDTERLVYISMGTINNTCIPLYKSCIEALKDSAMSVVMSVGNKVDIASLGAIPENFRIYRTVPQLAVLKRAKVFISHGGLNSVSESLYCGVPVVAIPQANDQPAVARRLAELGAGIAIRPDESSPGVIRSTVDKIMTDNAYQAACGKIAESFTRAGGYTAAADAIAAHNAALGIS